jgi:hypothetical protein
MIQKFAEALGKSSILIATSMTHSLCIGLKKLLTHPKICVLEVRAVVLNDVRRVALLHDGDLLDDLLQISINRNLKNIGIINTNRDKRKVMIKMNKRLYM